MSADARSLPKSILKTSLPSAHAAWVPVAAASDPEHKPGLAASSRQTTTTGQYKSKPGTDPRHLAVALHHAHRIQAQKDAKALILDRILELVQLPTSPSADPAAPSQEDAKAFKTVLAPFQPSDYDNLILERNIEGLCGYALCPHEHRREDPKVKNRIVWGPKGSGPGGRGREMNIVPREKLEMWCSDQCAERAMYVKVQLLEQPVWERRAGNAQENHIVLLEEARVMKQEEKGKTRSPTAIGEAIQQLGNLRFNEGPTGSSKSRDLALERGDSSPAFEAGRVDIQLVEKEHISPNMVAAPELRPEDQTGGSVEGYMPKEHKDTHSEDEEDQDILDVI